MSRTDFFVKNFGNRHEAKKKIISIFLANLLAAVAIDFFFSQKNFLSGGSTGIGLLVQYMTGIPTGVTVFLLNIPIMIIGYKYFTFRFEMLPIRIESNNVAKISKTIIPITSVGPANNGNT